MLHRGVGEAEAAPLAEIAEELSRKLKEGAPITPSDVDQPYELLRIVIAAAPQDLGFALTPRHENLLRWAPQSAKTHAHNMPIDIIDENRA